MMRHKIGISFAFIACRGVSMKLPASAVSTIKRNLSYPKFKGETHTFLLLEGRYFLYPELIDNLEALGHRVVRVPVGESTTSVMQGLLWGLVQHKPDCVLAVNHIGFDEDGQVGDLLEALDFPVAVWYVDSPHFVISQSKKGLPAPGVSSIFLWEKALIKTMEKHGAQDVHYLPLATDPNIFSVKPAVLHRECTFVGDSMEYGLRTWDKKLSKCGKKVAQEIATMLGADRQIPLSTLLEVAKAKLPKKGQWAAVAKGTWLATAKYRGTLVKAASARELQIFGDPGWRRMLPGVNYQGAVKYGPMLADIYRSSKINLNATHLQMPTAVNQRVFDAPAAGGFVLSDAQSAVEEHFEVGQEAIVYHDAVEMLELIDYYLRHETQRRKVIERAQQRVLAEHTYVHRLRTLVNHLRRRHQAGYEIQQRAV